MEVNYLTTINWSNFATETGNPVILVIGNGSNIKDADELAILKLKVDNNELLWENADGVEINISADNVTAVMGAITEDSETKYIQTSAFGYPTGVEEEIAENIEIYSTNNYVIIKGCNHDSSVKIFDVMGKMINAANVLADETQLSVNEKGIYIVTIFDKNRVIKSEKVIIK